VSNGSVGDWARVDFNAEGTEFAEEDGGTPPRMFFVRVANTGLMLAAASRIATKGDRGTVAGVERRVPNGAADEWARVDFNAPTGSGQGPCADLVEKDGYTPPRVFFVRVANTGLRLDAASRIATKGDSGTMASVE